MSWQISNPQYNQKVSSIGGYFDSKGASTTKNTWGTEAVDPSQWQSGGWYTNPNSGHVEQWWAGSQQQSSNNNQSGGSQPSQNQQSSGNQSVSLPQAPKIDLAGEYKSLYDSLGLSGFKEQIQAKQQEILALRGQTDEAIGLINENPWASAANRTGRIAKLEDQFNRKASVINAEAALIQQQYADARGELDTQMNLKSQQFNIDTQGFERNLTQLNSLLDMGALDNASMDSLQSIASQVGMSGDMIQSMVSAQKQAKINPTMLQHTDDYGNVTVTLIDANTGNVIKKENLGKVDASRLTPTSISGGGSGSSSTASGLDASKTAKLDGQILSIVSDIDANYGTVNGVVTKQDQEYEGRVADNLLSRQEYEKALNESYIQAKQQGYTGSKAEFEEYFSNLLISNGYAAWG